VILTATVLPSAVQATGATVPAFAGSVLILRSSTFVRIMPSAGASVALDGSGAEVTIACEDTNITDAMVCSLDLFTFDGRHVARANSSGAKSQVSLVTAMIPPSELATGVTLFWALPGVNHGWGSILPALVAVTAA
jgi:hypothetical protein